jgi:hypothetical protein
VRRKRRAAHREIRRYVDDLAVTAFLHAGYDGLCSEERSFHVHCHHGVECRFVDVLYRQPLPADAGIVDQDIHRTDCIRRGRDGCL